MGNLLHRNGWSWYIARTPKWLQWCYPSLEWRVKTNAKKVYLTFDDGPIPEVTEFVLDTLKSYHIKAHFFCIGKNALAHPTIFNRIIDEGHVIGNHTQNHVNGWKTNATDYLADFNAAASVIKTNIFRPPYGRIRRQQIKEIQAQGYRIIMWDVLSGDFDINIDATTCINNVIKNIKPGSIIVFHDSVKAFPRMKIALPAVLDWLKENGYDVVCYNTKPV